MTMICLQQQPSTWLLIYMHNTRGSVVKLIESSNNVTRIGCSAPNHLQNIGDAFRLSTSVRVIANCCPATSYYRSQSWTGSPTPLGVSYDMFPHDEFVSGAETHLTSFPSQYGRYVADDIFKFISINNVFRCEFLCNLFLRIKLIQQ